MLVYGLISPHPPIIIPEIGKENIEEVQQTIGALERACNELAAAKPDKLIIISPHSDHGFEVPKYYLHKYVREDIPTEEILVIEPSYEYYYEYGKRVGQEITEASERVAIVASGDLSHVLKQDGPYGYDAAGPVLDKTIVEAVQTRDMQKLLNIDPATLEQGAECGLRSILFLLGALENTNTAPHISSYEGPFGVGYLVATFPINVSARLTSATDLAKASLRHYFATGTLMDTPHNLPAALALQAGAFVSLHQKQDGELRGCIGTTVPTKNNIAAEIIANAVLAATQDPRFAPVNPSELDGLTVSVDILSPPIAETNIAALDPKRYGIIVVAGDGRQGLLLPNLDGVDSVSEQIAICRQKGNIDPNEPIDIYKFQATRYTDDAPIENVAIPLDTVSEPM